MHLRTHDEVFSTDIRNHSSPLRIAHIHVYYKYKCQTSPRYGLHACSKTRDVSRLETRAFSIYDAALLRVQPVTFNRYDRELLQPSRQKPFAEIAVCDVENEEEHAG